MIQAASDHGCGRSPSACARHRLADSGSHSRGVQAEPEDGVQRRLGTEGHDNGHHLAPITPELEGRVRIPLQPGRQAQVYRRHQGSAADDCQAGYDCPAHLWISMRPMIAIRIRAAPCQLARRAGTPFCLPQGGSGCSLRMQRTALQSAQLGNDERIPGVLVYSRSLRNVCALARRSPGERWPASAAHL